MVKRENFDPWPKLKKKRLNLLPSNPESANPESAVGLGRFPSWLHRQLPRGGNLWKTGKVLSEKRLHTVCEEAKCPNLPECWSRKTATFLVMGKECTRSCGFCDIAFNQNPEALDPDEPKRVADSVLELGLQHVVLTMVARDDLEDKGASHVAAVIAAVQKTNPAATIEVLTSDFSGKHDALDTIIAAKPRIFNHNIETVRELTPRVRHKATYDRTIGVLKYVFNKSKTLIVKSGLMLGLGETKEQVCRTICDLHDAGCQMITIGQYLQPNHKKLLVKDFITPGQFKEFEHYGYSIGVKHMFCGPFVRSSYNANLSLRGLDQNPITTFDKTL